MRIVIAGTQKSGNVLLKCLLAHAYERRVLVDPGIPRRPTLDAFRACKSAGGFVDGSVFHHHFPYSDDLADPIDAAPAHIATIVRDPNDSFVSCVHSVQRRTGRGFKRNAPSGKPMEHPDVLAYLRSGGDREELRLTKGWVESGRTTAVRYEDPHRNPAEVRSGIADNRAPRLHLRSARAGDSRKHLPDAHLAILRIHCGPSIESLGYPIRELPSGRTAAIAGWTAPPDSVIRDNPRDIRTIALQPDRPYHSGSPGVPARSSE